MTNENLKVGASALIVPNIGFQGQMWDVVRSNDDLAPLRKKLSMHDFRLLFEAIEPVFKSQQSRIDLLESPIREFLINVDENNRGEQELDIDHHIYNLRN